MAEQNNINPLNRYRVESAQEIKRSQSVMPDLQYTPWDAFVSSYQQPNTYHEMLWGMGTKKFAEMGDSRELSPEELNEKYNIKSDTPVKEDVAEILYENQQKERELQAIMSRVDPEATGSFAYPLIGSFMGSVGPIEIGVDYALSAGIGAAAKGLSTFNTFKRTAKAMKAMADANRATRIGAFAARGVGAGLMEGTVDAELSQQFAREMGTSFTDQDYMNTLMFSAGLGGLVGAGTGVWKTRGKYNTSSYAEGKRPKQNPAYLQLRDSNNYARLEGPPPKRTTGKYYSVHRAQEGNFNFGSQDGMGINLGEGIVATGDKIVAENYANSVFTGSKGQVVELDIADLKLVNLKEVATPEVRATIVKKLEDMGVPKQKAEEFLDNSNSLQNLFDGMDEFEAASGVKVRDEINKALKEEGYDGYEFQHRTSDNIDVEGAESGVFIFDPENVNAKNVDDYSQSSAVSDELDAVDHRQPMLEEIEYYDSIESNVNYDVDDWADMDKDLPELPKWEDDGFPPNTRDLDATSKEFREELESAMGRVSGPAGTPRKFADFKVGESKSWEDLSNAYTLRKYGAEILVDKSYKDIPYDMKTAREKGPAAVAWYHTGGITDLSEFDPSRVSEDIYYGLGMYFSDSIQSSVAYSGNSYAPVTFNVSLKDNAKLLKLSGSSGEESVSVLKKFVDLETSKLDTHFMDELNHRLDRAAIDNTGPKGQFTELRRFMDQFLDVDETRGVWEDFTDVMRKKGYDGMTIEQTVDNEMVIFATDKLDVKEVVQEIPSIIPENTSKIAELSREVAKAMDHCTRVN